MDDSVSTLLIAISLIGAFSWTAACITTTAKEKLVAYRYKKALEKYEKSEKNEIAFKLLSKMYYKMSLHDRTRQSAELSRIRKEFIRSHSNNFIKDLCENPSDGSCF